jgi:hypothetical protein
VAEIDEIAHNLTMVSTTTIHQRIAASKRKDSATPLDNANTATNNNTNDANADDDDDDDDDDLPDLVASPQTNNVVAPPAIAGENKE